MRADLLKQFGALRGITNAIVLTHNIDFVFLQSVVMSYLRRCGDPALTILADADCAATSFQAQRELLDGLGTRYRVVPIRMQPGFVFHPKGVLLTGPQGGILYVGSGNLTFGGFRQNGEVWSRFTSEEDGLQPFNEFRTFVASALERDPMSGTIVAELDDAFDPRTKPWTTTASPGEPRLLGRIGTGQSLLDVFAQAVGPEPIDELVVCSPYYDDGGEALTAVRERLPHASGLVMHAATGSTMTAAVWGAAGIGCARRACEIRHSHQIDERPGFVHAKFYAAIRRAETILIQGSANCTRAGLLMDGPRGNAELMSVVRVATDEFRRDWLDTLVDVPASELASASEAVPEPVQAPSLDILAARAEDGVILAAFHPKVAEITRCEIDGRSVPFTVPEPGFIRVPWVGVAAAIVLVGSVDGSTMTSAQHWIDHENQLRATALRRRLDEAIPRTLGGEHWTADQWVELLQALSEHLKYTPSRISAPVSASAPSARDSIAPRRYEDLFASEFSSSAVLAHWKELAPSPEAHDSIRKLLMRWFGMGTINVTDDVPPIEATSRGEGDEQEDLRIRPRQQAPTVTATLTERGRKKLDKTLGDIQTTMTTPEYLEFRSPDLLRTDLMMVGVILRFGFSKAWLTHQTFFAFTQAIWVPMFLSCTKDQKKGWLEWRCATAPDPAAFVAAMTSPQLSASMITWSLIGLEAPPSLHRARFHLARAMSAARVPHLWCGGSVEEVAKELSEVTQAGQDPIDPSRITAVWHDAVTQGAALSELDRRLSEMGVPQLLQELTVPTLDAGELLWQGAAGFCITVTAGSRQSSEPIETEKLQIGGTGNFVGNRTIPVRQVLETSLADSLANHVVESIGRLVSDLSRDVSGS